VSNYTGTSAHIVVRRSSVKDNASVGISVAGSTAEIDATAIAATQSIEEGLGYGMALQDDLDTGIRSDGLVTRSVLRSNTLAGIHVLASTLRTEATTIADTLAWIDPVVESPFDGGRGINVQDGASGGPSHVEVISSTIASSHGLGLFAGGSEVLIESAWIHDSTSAELENGRGVSLQPSVHDGTGATVTIRHCLISDNQQFGVFIGDSALALDGSELRGVSPAGELGFGDTLTVLGPVASASILDSRLADSGRAGLSLFGSSATMSGSVLSCHPIDIALQDVGTSAANLTDGGGNSCGCEELGDCKASSTDLEPPSPL
jgi:hypothetical protein